MAISLIMVDCDVVLIDSEVLFAGVLIEEAALQGIVFDPDAPDLLTGVAIAAAAELELILKSSEPRIIALGTDRALKATVEQLPAMDCPQHCVVSILAT
jgi:DNA-binding transcriptional regulator LsrR (DeoR family)